MPVFALTQKLTPSRLIWSLLVVPLVNALILRVLMLLVLRLKQYQVRIGVLTRRELPEGLLLIPQTQIARRSKFGLLIFPKTPPTGGVFLTRQPRPLGWGGDHLTLYTNRGTGYYYIVFYFFAVFFFVTGLCIGSFLNVLVLRHNTGLGFFGRSFCPSCGRSLTWKELIPLMSFALQKGRCKSCRSEISWQYPLVEFATGAVFLFTYLKYADCWSRDGLCFIYFLFGLLFWSIFIAIFVYDFKHKIIPDHFVYTLIFLSFIYRLAISASVYYFWDFFAPIILFAPFFLLWFFSKGAWIGFGDAKLAAAIGLILGLLGGIASLIYAFWIGAVVSLCLMAISKLVKTRNLSLKLGSKEITMKSEIAFGPFMIIGVFLVYFLGWGIPTLGL